MSTSSHINTTGAVAEVATEHSVMTLQFRINAAELQSAQIVKPSIMLKFKKGAFSSLKASVKQDSVQGTERVEIADSEDDGDMSGVEEMTPKCSKRGRDSTADGSEEPNAKRVRAAQSEAVATPTKKPKSADIYRRLSRYLAISPAQSSNLKAYRTAIAIELQAARKEVKHLRAENSAITKTMADGARSAALNQLQADEMHRFWMDTAHEEEGYALELEKEVTDLKKELAYVTSPKYYGMKRPGLYPGAFEMEEDVNTES